MQDHYCMMMASHPKKFRTFYKGKKKKKITLTCVQDIIDLARSEAKKSNMRQKHGCVITDNGGKYISKGHNTSYAYLNHGKRSLHAECSAIHNAIRQYGKNFLRGSILYVIRIGITCDSLKMSKPCKGCANAIIRFGISTAYYSTEEIDILTMVQRVKVNTAF